MPNKDFNEELRKLFESHDGELFRPEVKAKSITADDRLSQSFKEIIDFVEENDRKPDIESGDFNEALLAKRLHSIKNNPEKVFVLEQYDSLGLLTQPNVPKSVEDLFEKDEFGLFNDSAKSILNLQHVPIPTRAESAEIAKRKRAVDFSNFKDGFIKSQKLLESGDKKLIRFTNVNQIKAKRYFVSGGLLLFIDSIGEEKMVHGRMKSRIRAIFENGTESNMYLRSLSSQLYYDGYCLVDKDEIIDDLNDEEEIRGYIYVVKSLNEDLKISTIENLYKIGFSTTPVSKRISGSKDDPTYLMSEVELVESYRLTGNYNPIKVEGFLHRVFSHVAMDLTITDKNGRLYTPREWYCVPIEAIRHAVELIDSGEIINFTYDDKTQRMTESIM